MKVYRVVLVMILVAAIGGGAWYVYEAYRGHLTPQEGTLVYQCVEKCGKLWA